MQREGYKNRLNRFVGTARLSGKCALVLTLALWFDGAAVAGPIAPAELYAALSAAQGGERIELAAGDYGSLNITEVGATFSSDVTIVSADPGDPAIVRGLIVSDSSHLVFDGILFDEVSEPGADFRPFWVKNSAYITIRNSVFDGDAAGTYGLHLTDTDFVSIENNEFFGFNRGLVVYTSTNLTVSANDLHTLSSDGMNFVSVDGVLIEGNWFHDFDVGEGHPDMIQFWTKSGQMASQNVIIRDNFIDAGGGDLTQSIFMATGLPDGTYFDDVWKNILIENNVIYNAHGHGITVGETDGLVIRNNTLLYDAVALSQTTWADGGHGPPRIILNESSVNVTIEGNITADVWNWETMTDQPGWTVGNNLLVQYDNPGDENYYGDFFVNALVGAATLADLRAVAGGLIEQLIVGAAMTRFDIPLMVGPAATAPPPEPDICEVQLAAAQAEIVTLTQTNEMQAASLIAALTALAIAEGERDAAKAAETITQSELVSALVKLDAIRVIVEGN